MSTLEGRALAKFASQSQPNESSFPQAGALTTAPCVTILLCTFNGESFLEAQLASIERQSYRNWRLVISDDGSSDETLSIIERFADRVSQPVVVRSGPRNGPAANFLTLASDPQIEGDYFAFCDQDDVWYPDKLSEAVRRLESMLDDRPTLYGSRTHLVDTEGKHCGYAPLFDKQPTFSNALAQSIAGANTMVFNRAAKRLFEQTGVLEIVSHDWWAYQLVCGSGGTCIYDERPQLDYRQHPGNHIGCNRGWRAQFKRLVMVLRGGFARWNEVNFAALEACRPHLTEAARADLDRFMAMRTGSLPTRLATFARSDIRRQSLTGNLALLIAILLKKL